jgi:hypothetical protein
MKIITFMAHTAYSMGFTAVLQRYFDQRKLTLSDDNLVDSKALTEIDIATLDEYNSTLEHANRFYSEIIQCNNSLSYENSTVASEIFSAHAKLTKRVAPLSWSPLDKVTPLENHYEHMLNAMVDYAATTCFERTKNGDEHEKRRREINRYMDKYLPSGATDTFMFNGEEISDPKRPPNGEFVGRPISYYGKVYADWYYRVKLESWEHDYKITP